MAFSRSAELPVRNRGIEPAKSLDRETTRLPVLPSRGDNNTDDDN